ncbi:LOW QUALITY PROTEIN: protein trichome birefringence-like 2 [Durio zibethinus]|uniref:LOW QUALITY PROTEIN: protein trichome birefringence-like 2 n=1 Tax=Durio zibethinus TaxID=66656 RepID=A0A6P5XCD9_DURZI|nr:LOW QUALITY PROTEIN: protein trichome birefringence-like 2 [Durio zibethinus]
MDGKKPVLSEQMLPRGKVFSRLGWGLVASLIVITGLLLNNSLKGPVVGSPFQGSYSVRSATVSLHSSLQPPPPPSSSSSLQRPVDAEKTIEIDNASKVAEQQDFLEESEGDEVDLEDGVDIDIEGTQLENSDEGTKTGNFGVEEEGKIQQATQDANGSIVPESGNPLSSNGDGVILEKTHLGNFSKTVNNGTLVGENVNANKAIEGEFVDHRGDANNMTTENNNVGNLLSNGEKVVLPIGEEKAMELIDQGPDGSFETCDFFDGRWVRDDHSKPYYRPGSCPYIDKDFECQRNGRPDNGYIKWKWQPNGCEIPRLNATDFLERLRGKRLVFIGDSLNRNMWESMVCILRRSVKKKKRVYEISGRSDFKKKGFYAFRFEDYNCSVDFVAAPFLVKESSFKRENGSIETLRLDLMDPSTSMFHDADLMVFNTGHWWTHEKTSKGEELYQETLTHVLPDSKSLSLFQGTAQPWSRWVDKNVDSSRTQVFFRGYSVTHFWGGQWNSGGRCHQETEPISNETYLTKYPSKMRAVEYVLQNTKTPVIYLNISRLTDYRKDAHPSIYRREYKTEEERNAAVRVQDCSHWCLPGVPDTWNELLYASLLKAGRGIWRN